VAADGSPLWRRLRAHDVWDIGVQHRQDGVEVGVGVSNLFDERYSTVAYNQTYYPMPGRQAYIKVSMQH
jgi:outer membrane receptor protein involved in Fe transport